MSHDFIQLCDLFLAASIFSSEFLGSLIGGHESERVRVVLTLSVCSGAPAGADGERWLVSALCSSPDDQV